jgi:hypothetical protein
MPVTSVPTYEGTNGPELPAPVPVVVIESVSSGSGEIPAPQRSALAAADVVLHEENVDPAALAFVARGAFVEPVVANGHAMLARASAIARARKLASEGWRVVWLAAGDANHLALDFAKAGIASGDGAAAGAFVASGREPHLLATALNGLAG